MKTPGTITDIQTLKVKTFQYNRPRFGNIMAKNRASLDLLEYMLTWGPDGSYGKSRVSYSVKICMLSKMNCS